MASFPVREYIAEQLTCPGKGAGRAAATPNSRGRSPTRPTPGHLRSHRRPDDTGSASRRRRWRRCSTSTPWRRSPPRRVSSRPPPCGPPYRPHLRDEMQADPAASQVRLELARRRPVRGDRVGRSPGSSACSSFLFVFALGRVVILALERVRRWLGDWSEGGLAGLAGGRLTGILSPAPLRGRWRRWGRGSSSASSP